MSTFDLGEGYSLRLTTADEVYPVVKEAILESPYKDFEINEEHIKTNLDRIGSDLSSGLLVGLYHNDQAVGIIVGILGDQHPLIYGHKIANEVLWYVSPSHRGKYSLKLIDAFEEWALRQNATMLVLGNVFIESMDKVAKLYEKKNYIKFEESYMKVLV